MLSLLRKSPYILLIMVLIGSFLLFSLWSARQATTKGPEISDPDYYSKGLKYNNTRIEERAAASQGWQLDTIIDHQSLEFHLSDSTGKPVSKAVGLLTLYLSADNQVMRIAIQEQQPGLYRLQLPETLSGSLHARIEFEHSGARISRRLLVNL
ncbi:MAG: FixH family protein [Geopsychrobacter sp.]|nr:FixH family protein [Geopsychrobacter sp.]